MKALIDPRVTISYISGWNTTVTPFEAIITTIPNSGRVAEVCENDFQIAPPLYWVVCADNVIADQFWCDTVTNVISEIPPTPPPPQPESTGTQTL